MAPCRRCRHDEPLRAERLRLRCWPGQNDETEPSALRRMLPACHVCDFGILGGVHRHSVRAERIALSCLVGAQVPAMVESPMSVGSSSPIEATGCPSSLPHHHQHCPGAPRAARYRTVRTRPGCSRQRGQRMCATSAASSGHRAGCITANPPKTGSPTAITRRGAAGSTDDIVLQVG